jgi:hypothetical protein
MATHKNIMLHSSTIIVQQLLTLTTLTDALVISCGLTNNVSFWTVLFGHQILLLIEHSIQFEAYHPE